MHCHDQDGLISGPPQSFQPATTEIFAALQVYLQLIIIMSMISWSNVAVLHLRLQGTILDLMVMLNELIWQKMCRNGIKLMFSSISFSPLSHSHRIKLGKLKSTSGEKSKFFPPSVRPLSHSHRIKLDKLKSTSGEKSKFLPPSVRPLPPVPTERQLWLLLTPALAPFSKVLKGGNLIFIILLFGFMLMFSLFLFLFGKF